MKFTFSFNCNYEPDLGKIEVEGQVLFMETAAKAEEILNFKPKKSIEVGINDNGFYLAGENMMLKRSLEELNEKNIEKLLKDNKIAKK